MDNRICTILSELKVLFSPEGRLFRLEFFSGTCNRRSSCPIFIADYFL